MQHKVGSLGPAYITFHKYPINHKGSCIVSLPGILHISVAILTQPLGLLNSMDPSFEVWSHTKACIHDYLIRVPPDMSSSVLLIWREPRDQADRAHKFMTYSQ